MDKIPKRRIVNIYLDVDGVLRGTASPRSDVQNLVEFILTNFPESTYWLTTHCRRGVNHCARALRGYLSDNLVDRMEAIIQPTDWQVMKTDAIDMEQDFVWLDDNLFESEMKVLEANHVVDGFFRMNPRDPEMAKKALARIKSEIN